MWVEAAWAEEAVEDGDAPADIGEVPPEGAWVGGAIGGIGGWSSDGPRLDGQAEVDARWAKGLVYLRADVDVRADAIAAAGPGPLTIPYPPEWAMLQIGRDGKAVRLGVVSASMGFEDYDEWNNYLPTVSNLFDPGQNGRNLGMELAWPVPGGDGQVFAFGGWDLDWGAWAVGTGVWMERDLVSTWSGVVVFPDLQQGFGLYAIEAYPSDLVSIVLDGTVGYAEGGGFVGAQAMVAFYPDLPVLPVLRVEGLFDPTGGLGGADAGVADWTASGGGRLELGEVAVVSVEAKVSGFAGAVVPGGYVGVWARRRDPPTYAARPE